MSTFRFGGGGVWEEAVELENFEGMREVSLELGGDGPHVGFDITGEWKGGCSIPSYGGCIYDSGNGEGGLALQRGV